MPQQRVTMRKIREILRLAWSCGQSRKAIAKQCGVGKTTVTFTIARATAAGLAWPLPPLDDDALELRLYPPVPLFTPRKAPLPDWSSLHRELVTRKDLTLMLLWQEYKAGEPNGYQIGRASCRERVYK